MLWAFIPDIDYYFLGNFIKSLHVYSTVAHLKVDENKGEKPGVNPLTAGAVQICFLHFLLAYYISVFKPFNDKTWH